MEGLVKLTLKEENKLIENEKEMTIKYIMTLVECIKTSQQAIDSIYMNQIVKAKGEIWNVELNDKEKEEVNFNYSMIKRYENDIERYLNKYI